MITGFVFDGVEAASWIGTGNAVMRRVPERGHVECKVQPLRNDGCRYKRAKQMEQVIHIYASVDGKPPYVIMCCETAFARDLYESLRSNGIAIDVL